MSFLKLGFSAKDAVKAAERKDITIIIDVLRCSSTIISLLAKGAKEIFIAKSLREAREIHSKLENSILVGERHGIKPKGFNFGNSPLEFTKEDVKEKSVILTTTSGAKAIYAAKNSEATFIGAFLNAKFVSEAAFKKAKGKTISLIASGKKNEFSLEDFICCGAIASELIKLGSKEFDDGIKAAILAWKTASLNLKGTIKNGTHAKYLIQKGFEKDVEFCSNLNTINIVPIYKNGIIQKL
ncbi:MAG: 2-phosphosulfolactate phosphatase [Candidatus Bathyarchaeia archaeon]|nr:2-phosphosulfolactate phosphatase [Candidatus Bathyarchaeota archaeon]